MPARKTADFQWAVRPFRQIVFSDRVATWLAEHRAVPDALAGTIRRVFGAVLLAEVEQGFGFTDYRRFGFACLDYICGSGVRFEQVDVLPDALSDHHALLLRFQLR